MIDLRLCAFEMGAVLEDDEIHVAVARGEFLRRGRSAGVHDRRMGLLQRLGLAPDRGGIEALATEIELLVLRPRGAPNRAIRGRICSDRRAGACGRRTCRTRS